MWRILAQRVWTSGSVLHRASAHVVNLQVAGAIGGVMHADPVAIDKIASLPARKAEDDHNREREHDAPGLDSLFGALGRSDRKADGGKRHRADITEHVLPGRAECSYATVAGKISKTRCGREKSGQEPRPHQPHRAFGKVSIGATQTGKVARKSAEPEGDGENNQDRMERMTRYPGRALRIAR
jgi:hypothetical protein